MANSRETLDKAIFHLFNHLQIAKEQYFRPLSEEALTNEEYCEIQITAVANYLRYTIHACVKPESRNDVIDKICEGMKVEIELKAVEEEITIVHPFPDAQKVDFVKLVNERTLNKEIIVDI